MDARGTIPRDLTSSDMAEGDHLEPGLLRIHHSTHYRYAQPVRFGPHRLVIRPREGHDLRVERLLLEISPENHVVWSRDVFGNSIAHVHFTEEAAELKIVSETIVRRFADSPPHRLPLDAPVSLPVVYDALEKRLVSAYQEPIYPDDSQELRSWLDSLEMVRAASEAEDLVLQLTRRIRQDITYRRRDEKGVQSPAATLKLGSGSCRDVATLLSEAARHLGIATRFASGYLDCPATRAAQGSTHAWAEAYFPSRGWRGFDPTTGKRSTFQHVLTGVSNHPRGVMPVSGHYSGPPGSYLGMSATVSFSRVEEEAVRAGGGRAQDRPRSSPRP